MTRIKFLLTNIWALQLRGLITRILRCGFESNRQFMFALLFFIIATTLRRLVRVFHCSSVCEMMKDYKKLHLWANFVTQLLGNAFLTSLWLP